MVSRLMENTIDSFLGGNATNAHFILTSNSEKRLGSWHLEKISHVIYPFQSIHRASSTRATKLFNQMHLQTWAPFAPPPPPPSSFHTHTWVTKSLFKTLPRCHRFKVAGNLKYVPCHFYLATTPPPVDHKPANNYPSVCPGHLHVSFVFHVCTYCKAHISCSRWPGKTCSENRILPTALTARGSTATSASTCARPSVTSLFPPSVEFPMLSATAAASPASRSFTSGRSLLA